MRLLLIRHGQTPSNVLGLLDTAAPGAGLTALGSEQAAAIPVALAGQPIEMVAVSNLIRTQQTAAPLAAERRLSPEIRQGLREISAGRWEMAGDAEALHGYLGTIGQWLEGNLDPAIPGGEHGRDVLERFDQVIEEIADAGVVAGAVVSHGAMIRVWATLRSRNLSAEFGRSNHLGNTGIVVVEGDPWSGWMTTEWMGTAIGGSELDEPAAAGPTAEGPDS
jgi:broad specificity phosphatase PhoE